MTLPSNTTGDLNKDGRLSASGDAATACSPSGSSPVPGLAADALRPTGAGRLRPLTERDWELLASLEYFNDSYSRGATPLGLGGSNRSYHSGSLAKMARRGLVRKNNWALGEDGRRHGDRGSCLYWITDEGRDALAEYRAALSKAHGQ